MEILVDVDGVLADFVTPCLRVIADITGVERAHDDVTVWDFEKAFIEEGQGRGRYWRTITAEGFCAALRPYEGAVAGVARLRELGEVYAVTSPMLAPTWADERRLWLKEHFDIDHKHVVSTPAKFLVSGAALIDDKPEHVQAWMRRQSGLGILWAQAYNAAYEPDRGCSVRTRSWDKVYDLLR